MRHSCHARSALAWLVALAFVAGIGVPSPALALSEIQREDVPGATQANPPDGTSDTPIEKQTLPPVGTVPIPDSTTSPPADAEPAAPPHPDEAAPDDEAPDHEGSPDAARPDVDPTPRCPKSSTISTGCRSRSGACTTCSWKPARAATSKSCGR